MRHRTLVLASLFGLLVGACVGGAPASSSSGKKHLSAPRPRIIYDHGDDGSCQPDGVDLDGDGDEDCSLGGDENGDGCDEQAVDADGDGLPDGVDLNCDGQVDIPLPGLEDPADCGDDGGGGASDPGSGAGDPGDCEPALVDTDGDGAPDGLDLDCDGNADFSF
jgi:hypothetical protein